MYEALVELKDRMENMRENGESDLRSLIAFIDNKLAY